MTNTIGSIATHIVESITVSAGISGNMVEIVDLSRIHVQNYTGDTIGSNSIPEKYQSAITNFAKADVLHLIGGDSSDVSLAELSISEGQQTLSAEQYRKLAEMSLNALGRKIQYAKSLS